MEAIPVYSLANKKVDTLELKAEIFYSPVNPSLVHRAVVMQGASERQGTASTRGRGEVRGGGKKPWKQKHTGRARAGSSRSPIWRSGGIAFGPKPRTYSSPMPRKMYRNALRSALASKLTDNELIIVEDMSLPEMKTRVLMKTLSGLGATGKVVLVVEESLEGVIRIGKNARSVKVLHAKDLNVYDVLWCDKLVVTRAEMQRIEEVWV